MFRTRLATFVLGTTLLVACGTSEPIEPDPSLRDGVAGCGDVGGTCIDDSAGDCGSDASPASHLTCGDSGEICCAPNHGAGACWAGSGACVAEGQACDDGEAPSDLSCGKGYSCCARRAVLCGEAHGECARSAEECLAGFEPDVTLSCGTTGDVCCTPR